MLCLVSYTDYDCEFIQRTPTAVRGGSEGSLSAGGRVPRDALQSCEQNIVADKIAALGVWDMVLGYVCTKLPSEFPATDSWMLQAL
ncbi:hypothetical protein M0R45_016648 [Rubus argutus]|uniref:Uncharacterized protein n=1 Tax=Rubus argutus TaxID=59490 RepID=A0AAW1XTQ6_RUBAR